MAKLTLKYDAAEIFDRAVAGSNKYQNMSQLAEAVGVTPQSVQQCRQRRSLSLPLLIEISEKTGLSFDFLLYGVERKTEGVKADEGPPQDDRYAEITTISTTEDPDVVRFDKKWLEVQLKGKKSEILRQIVLGDVVYIVDTLDIVVADGVYVFGHEEHLNKICSCKRKLDGTIVVQGEDEATTQEALISIGIVGRVVWKGSLI